MAVVHAGRPPKGTNTREQRKYARNKSLGRCVYCGGKHGTPAPGMVMCEWCRGRKAMHNRTYRRQHPDRQAKLNKERRERFKREGRCQSCGTPLPEISAGSTKCINCIWRVYAVI